MDRPSFLYQEAEGNHWAGLWPACVPPTPEANYTAASPPPPPAPLMLFLSPCGLPTPSRFFSILQKGQFKCYGVPFALAFCLLCL